MLPIAIKCGMTPYDFWNGEPSLFYTYLDAYQDRINEEAWLFGLYTHIAVATSVGNMFLGKGKKPLEYEKKPIDFKQQAKIANMTKEHKEKIAKEHFNYQARISNFVKNKK